ncbi:hypothetical protein SADUNF_Sadunf08G0067100 [Salix dunnii]|uniref:Retrotransposon Copia-like N-terminal domain-containing protein n=1 Tax=Salix dunnii TaxID=1413687 RepID=A0A835N151_9ROSI|nr:hypothetical protein SADUNF_Sadunf08G0067100 [Salix dunnii]
MAENTTDSSATKEQRKTISPYDITSLDNPGFTITQVQLKGDNYEEWARSIRTALRARKKFGFIDGTIKQPDKKSEDLEDWWTINSLLVSWIRNTIEPSHRSSISHVEIAQELWKDLEDRFFITNGPRIQQLRSSLAECKQRGINKAYSILIQEERVKMIARGRDDQREVMALAARTRPRMFDPNRTREPDGRDRGNMFCDHCKKVGHEATTCFELKGYPEWWGERPRSDGRHGSGRGRGPMNGRSIARANTAQVSYATEKDPPPSTLPGLTTEQWEILKKMLEPKEANELIMGKMTDGNSIIATKEGTIPLETDLTLQKDRISRMLIGAGERRDGLYYFKRIPRVQALRISRRISLDLWHKRLGHLSMRIIQLVPEVEKHSDNVNEICDVC